MRGKQGFSNDRSKALGWRLCTRHEIAEMLDISLNHLTHLVQQRLIPHYRLGRCLRFDPDEVREALKYLKQGPN